VTDFSPSCTDTQDIDVVGCKFGFSLFSMESCGNNLFAKFSTMEGSSSSFGSMFGVRSDWTLRGLQ